MKSNQEGFTYIDVMIGVTILLVGVLALAAAVTTAVVRSREAEQQMIARQLVSSTIESIFSARDIGQLGWDAIGNVGTNPVDGVNKGIFVAGAQVVKSDTGPDNIVGTADDTGTIMPIVTRQITITDLCDPDRPSPNCPTPGNYAVTMRQVNVIVNYRIGNLQRQERATTIMTNYK